jgi:hypothetical protein
LGRICYLWRLHFHLGWNPARARALRSIKLHDRISGKIDLSEVERIDYREDRKADQEPGCSHAVCRIWSSC